MTIKVLNEFLPNAEIQRVGAVKVGDTLEITQDEGVLNVDPASVVSAYYSNIVTEIPQDIKLELNDGTLILKAGSKVYIPNGSGKFDVITVPSDITLTSLQNRTGLLYYTSGSIYTEEVGRSYSGSSYTGGDYGLWYDTTNNKIGYTSNGGSSFSYNRSLPLAIITVTTSGVTSIDQVFNGAGYIGHHAFILPGLRGVAPDGLGDKGYVKSVNIEVNNVLVYDLTSGSVTDFDNSFLFLNPVLEVACQRYITVDRAKELIRTTGLIQYAYQENKDYAWNGTAYINPINLPVVECSLKNSTVTYFRILQPLRMATVADIKESTDSFLFDYKWADHNPNKLSWLRADTFNWQDGSTYKSAYKHLVEDFNGTTSATETIGSNTITYYLAADKHKIVLPDQESIVQAIYNETGIAWYYILDTANTRFKLPRTKFGFVGIRDGVGNYVTESLPNITGHSCLKQNDNDGNPTGAFYRANSNAYTGFNSGNGHFIDFDASRSSSAYQDNAPVQQRATQMYLYCYVGRANQDALEKSEIDIIAFTNNSINQLTSAKNTSLSAINTATEEGINRLNTDSNALNRTQITNCITEIPQDIKLELVDGVLTVKNGSVLTSPDGTQTQLKYDKAVTWGGTTTSPAFVVIRKDNQAIGTVQVAKTVSGTSDTLAGSTYHAWYDTTNKVINLYTEDGTTPAWTTYFPIAIITFNSSGVESIDQVFNGFGYIGSTIFALPGVKGLIPDGRNEDGTLRNIEVVNSKVKTANLDNGVFTLVVSTTSIAGYRDTIYNYEKNLNENNAGSKQLVYYCGYTTVSSGVITSFQTKTPFHAVDYSDFSTKQDITTAVNYDNITNCITKIPQDIKLELADGTLTLKAGSKVCVPNGAGKFDVVTIASDVSTTRTDSQDCIAWYNTNTGTMQLFPTVLFYSGSTAPSGIGTFAYWYDTANNKCKVTGDNGSVWVEGKSFPLCLASTDGTKISAIKQVFNGFGYVGGTIFVLPGVKGLIPNGRNEDGSLKNTEFTTNRVLTATTPSGSLKTVGIWIAQQQINTVYVRDKEGSGMWAYHEDINYNMTASGIASRCLAGTYDSANLIITSLHPKTSFHAVDYNEVKSVVFPSQVGKAGKALLTDGENAYWGDTSGVIIRDWSV